MSDWVVLGAWMAIYLFTPERKRQKGLPWRLLRKIPPWRFLKGDGVWECVVRFQMFCSLSWTDYFWPKNVHHLMAGGWISGLLILAIGDYMHDDDYWKHKWKQVRNKLKWKMDLPELAPARSRAR